ncbi:MAG TPA: hypothetical protein PKK48_07750, partial [Phycisphaerae bacterium]|nr:hypothetical protein [Phycisphaerae bacterium]
MKKYFFLFNFAAICWISTAAAQFGQSLSSADSAVEPSVKVKVVADRQTVRAGQAVTIAVEVTIPDGWVYYGPVQKPDTVVPCSLNVTAGGMELEEL